MEKEMTQKRLFICTIILVVLLIAAGFIILVFYPFTNHLMWTAGALFGGLFSCLKIWMIGKSLDKSVEMESNRASNYMRGQFMLRYLATFLFLAAALLLRQYISPVSAIISLLLMQPAAYLTGWWERRIEKKTVKTSEPVLDDAPETLTEEDLDLSVPSFKDSISEVVNEIKGN